MRSRENKLRKQIQGQSRNQVENRQGNWVFHTVQITLYNTDHVQLSSPFLAEEETTKNLISKLVILKNIIQWAQQGPQVPFTDSEESNLYL
jgi:hypothetical protein